MVKPDQISAEAGETWRRLLDQAAGFDSPFFRPEFAALIGQVRPDAEVAILTKAGRQVGFLPFRRQGTIGRPLAGVLSDFEGLVLEQGVQVGDCELLAACGLSAWRFDHWLADQSAFASGVYQQQTSPMIDLSSGYAAYCQVLQQSGRTWVQKTHRKKRKLEREVGPVTFRTYDHSPATLAQLLAWKAEQYQRTGQWNPLQTEWVQAFLPRLVAQQSADFAGWVASVWAGDQLVAACLGMRSANVAHPWFPAYSPAFARYSPGRLLLLEMAEAFADQGMTRVDLGKGPEEYKQHFATGSIAVAEGSVERSPLTYAVRRGWRQTQAYFRQSPLRRPLLAPYRLLRNAYRRMRYS
ncbi:GNAT family N-acetyltransferase [Lignipirellula cremea]|uniref:GNAT family N-acetyltransferase n=1 Tax=Lignipirellula cremea TaxID=2528010 RepID=UPI0018D225F2|nr:GNAT family N-acetyltransferase [Lignipirellula cremea]